MVCYDKRHLKPPGPEKVWIGPPPTQGADNLRPYADSSEFDFSFLVLKCGIRVVFKPSGVQSAKQSPRGSSNNPERDQNLASFASLFNNQDCL